MKKFTNLDSLIRLVMSGVAISALLCGMAIARPTGNVVSNTSIHSRTGTLLADGTESNGGKGGGKPGSHRSQVA